MLNGMEDETFGQRLKRLRLVSGKSQRQIARETGLSNGTISQAESDALWVGQSPSTDIVRRLAKALGVTLDEIAPDPDTIQPSPASRIAVLSDLDLLIQIGAEPFSGDDTVSIEDFAASARTGKDNLIPQNFDEMRPKRGKQPRKPKPEPHIFKLRISGNCMKDTVRDGEIVWFDTWLPREPVALVLAVRDEHEAHIKRLVDRTGQRWLEADDGWAEPVDERWRILAVAFTAQRNLIF